MKTTLFGTLLLLLLGSCSREDALLPADLTNNPLQTQLDAGVDAIYQTYRDGLNTPGLIVGILQHDGEHYYGYGETQRGSGRIPDAVTYFEIGSITKTFTALATIDWLHSQGLSPDTPIRPYLPADLPTLNRGGVELTFRHLLSHTSGLPYMPANFGLDLYTNPARAWAAYDTTRLYSCLLNVQLEFEPGTAFHYSNLAVGLLGVILERQYGQDYGDLIRQRVLRPLGLTNVHADFKDTDPLRWAVGYQQGRTTPYWKSFNALDGAGVLKATPRELLRYASLQLQPPPTPLGQAMQAAQQVVLPAFRTNDYYRTRPTLGWFEYQNHGLPDETFLFHDGGTGGFNSELFIHRPSGRALVVIYNQDGPSATREHFQRDLLNLLLR